MIVRHFFAVLGICISLLPLVATGKGIDLSDRNLPVLVTESGILTGTLQSRFVPGSSSLLVKPELTAETAAITYGLFVPGLAATTITLNSQGLITLPLERPDGHLYMVDPMYLQDGVNSVRIDRAEPQSWSGLTMFSLRDTIEEAHFAETFSPAEETAAALAARDIQPSPLQTNYDVLWYDCTWVPNMFSARMDPGSEITMCAKALVNNLQTVEMDFDRNLQGNGGPVMTIVRVDSGPGTPELNPIYNSSTFRLSITLPAPIAEGQEFKIRISYHGAPNTIAPSELFSTNPMYASTTGAGRPVVYSVSQPYGGRRWWPSKDHPSDKATTTIQRIVVPKTSGYTLRAISNGVLKDVVDGGSTLTYIWQNDHPIATYLMSFAVSDYVYYGGTYTSRDGQTTMPLGHWIYPENVGIEGNGYLGTLQAMNFFADKFGEYPFVDQKYQTATWNISYAIEHQTATSMPAGTSGGVGNGLTRRNIHELAHQWFGNKVTCANWDHTWLNEGFATYCEALFFEFLYGRGYFLNYVDGWNPSTSTPVVGPASQNFASSTVYHKGAVILHMLRYVLGDEAFFQALKDYAATGYTTAVSQPPGDPADFQSSVEVSAGLPAGSLSNFFTQWLYSPNASYSARPDYSFSAAYNPSTSSANVRVSQHQSGDQFHMPIDVQFRSADNQTTTVRISAATTEFNINLGDFVPVSADYDIEDWIFKRRRAQINTASLPGVPPNQQFSFVLQGDSGAGGLVWQKQTGSPAWVSVASNGMVSGAAPAAGIYPVNIRLTDNAGVSANASFSLVVTQLEAPPEIVINELLYEMYGVSDTGEYVELKNKSSETVNVSGWQLAFIDGATGEPTVESITLPSGSTIAPGDYFVIGNASALAPVFGSVVDANVPWQEALQDGAPDAVVLKTAQGLRVDSVNYRGDSSFASGSYTGFALAEGGTGRGLSRALSDSGNAVLGRLPDGVDTDINLVDFAMMPPTPGAANSAGVTLPFSDDFNSGARPEWKPAFDGPVRTVSPGQSGKPPVAAPAPAGGNVMEVYDSAGGGDVVYLPGDFNKINVEGYLWIPQTVTSQAWSIGVGVGTRVESAWFSTTPGFGLEHGLYLEYQNGPGLGLKGGRVPDSSGTARLIAANSTSAPNAGISGFSALVLGSPATLQPSTWQPFRIALDVAADRIIAKAGNQELYNGPIPAFLEGCRGGVTIGFRENHSGGPSSANREGTWVDNIIVNTDTAANSAVKDYNLY